MSEADNKWDKEALKFAGEYVSDLVHPTKQAAAVSGYIIGIKDYKGALRREIEKEIKELDKLKLSKEMKYADAGVVDGKLKECRWFLNKLDTVEP